jgi:hypothetical protein
MPDPGKPTAHMYSADIKRENAYAPLIDACFYCGKKFGESSSRRGVRTKTGGTLIAHSNCADRYETDGPPARPKPEEPPSFSGKNIHFPTVEEFQTFVAQRGPIPSAVRITVGDQVINEGENHEHQGD